jgi:hypothetical protein
VVSHAEHNSNGKTVNIIDFLYLMKKEQGAGSKEQGAGSRE